MLRILVSEKSLPRGQLANFWVTGFTTVQKCKKPGKVAGLNCFQNASTSVVILKV
jgi:hypothetical protein